jgi:hypothetical protein
LTQVFCLRIALDVCGQEVALCIKLTVDPHGLPDMPGKTSYDLICIKQKSLSSEARLLAIFTTVFISHVFAILLESSLQG